MQRKRTYTIAEAAELTGLSRKALARRVERGSLRSVVRNGRRLIPRSELVRGGLLPADGEERGFEGEEERGSDVPSGGLLVTAATPEADPNTPLVALVRDLMERVERQATEIAQFRALTVQAESLRADRELSELRARLTSLETRAPHQAQATPPGTPTADADALGARAPAQPAAPIWLPPSATAAPAPTPAPPAQRRLPEPPPHTLVGRGWNRAFVLILEAAFIVLVGLGATLAGLDSLAVLAVIGAAWLVVAVAEAVAWYGRRF